ncbi:phosphatidylinositol-specific phospholipase C domain-containing protein [Nocardia arthritidis]|uniref:1-phosphatidylinositol phosphodiesterase n=1 Tax=Nocardia arthritidis TaxID=228602 RepID=A0A6G9Y8Z1_9NOCA|nr:phosphatidylinositol-specific phospholipase C domain-containing protein [Nocardia arthritidis]QIS09614.1 hypothetical protein F5544_08560 [Nocardia arthritidis]
MVELLNWMSAISDELSVTEVSIPGSDRSAALRDGEPFGYAQHQEKSIGWQLAHGIRYLDIRCRVLPRGGLEVQSGPVDQRQTLADVLETCAAFLDQLPSETLLLRIRQEGSGDELRFCTAFRDHLDRRGFRKLFHLASTFPTMAEARGKVVLMSGNPYIGEGIRFDKTRVDLQDDYDDPTPEQKLACIRRHLDRCQRARSTAKLFVNSVSASGAVSNRWTPLAYADELNPHVPELLGKYAGRGRGVGVIVCDYVNRLGLSEPETDQLITAVVSCNDLR